MKPSELIKLCGKASTAACLAGIAATVAWALWFVVEPPAAAPFGASSISSGTSSALARDIGPFLISNPFGAVAGGVSAPVNLDLQETRLDLELTGIFKNANRSEESVAMISANGRNAKKYRVDDTLPGFAKLVAIHSNSVELVRDKVREVLSFRRGQSLIKPDRNNNSGYRSPRAARSSIGNAEISVGAGKPLDRNAATIPSLGESARQHRLKRRKSLNTVSEGLPAMIEQGLLKRVSPESASGYLLTSDFDSPELKSLALREGDVVLAINGMALGSDASDSRVIQKALAPGSSAAKLRVRRGKRVFEITVPTK